MLAELSSLHKTHDSKVSEKKLQRYKDKEVCFETYSSVYLELKQR